MKIPSVKQVATQVSNYIRNSKIEKHEAKLANFVVIKDLTQKNAEEAIYEAREILANYAKANNVKIYFQSFPKTEPAFPLANRFIGLSVTRGRKVEVEFVPADVSGTYKKVTKHQALLENKDGFNYVSSCENSTEDTFIRHIYRCVEKLTNKINGKRQ